MPTRLKTRGIVFLLASLSFACLLGQFYSLWSMHWFGCWILPPATFVLIALAWFDRGWPSAGPRVWIVQGAIGGIVAAIAYDLYRLPFVLGGAPLFKVFGKFGNLLLGAGVDDQASSLAQWLGWTYHFSNGAALGIMFLAMVVRPNRRTLFWGAVAWALCVEAILLTTPYAKFFGLPLNGWFLFLTASAHAIFGVVLGLWCRSRIAPRLAATAG
ncbi:MAG TPA: hypothetical protein VGY55_05730 [Pirellulales bacterium]|jgi:hypothetical protein|nr:hypothetical protein [Pirellulales bacterium]